MCGPPKDSHANSSEPGDEVDTSTHFSKDVYLPQHLGYIVYKNGNFITMTEAEPRTAHPDDQINDQSQVQFSNIVQALGVVDGKIVALGSDSEVYSRVIEFCPDASQDAILQVDLQNKYVVPGFVGSHEHLAHEGLHVTHLNFFYDDDAMSSKQAAMAHIRDYADALRLRDQASGRYDPLHNRWIHGFNWDNFAPGFDDISREELDALCPDYPVKIYHTSLHRLYFNSQAMRRMPHDVFDGMPDPPEGCFHRLADGATLSGIADEHATHIMARNIPAEPHYPEKLVLGALRFASRGITSLYDAYSWDSFVHSLYHALQSNGAQQHPPFPLRVGMYFGEHSQFVPAMVEASPWFIPLGRKFVLDGGLLIRTGALTQPYFDRPGWKGELRDPDVKRLRILDFHSKGVPMALHANGDAAVDFCLDVLEEAQRLRPDPAIRHRLEHVQVVRPDQLDRMARLGVMANFFISHIFYYGDRHRLHFFGPERAAKLNPLRSALQHRVQFAMHNDNPVTPTNPLHTMWIASNRITRAGVLLGQDETISIPQSLRAFTVDAAYQGYQEEHVGQLQVGKYADFVVLSENPLKYQASPMKLKDIHLHMTVQSGHITYSDDTIPAPEPLTFWAKYLKRFAQVHPDFFLGID